MVECGGCVVRMRSDRGEQWPLSRNVGFIALARCSAGQRGHIKPGKLHQGNKMAIK